MSIDSLFALFGQIFLYLTIAIVVVGILVFLTVYTRKKEKLKTLKQVTTIFIYVYAMIVSIVMLSLKFETIKADETIDFESYKYLLWPLVATLITLILGGGSILVCGIKFKSKIKLVGGVFGVLLIGCFIAIMICMSKYFELVAQWYPNTNLTGLIVSAVVFIFLIALMYFASPKSKSLNTKSIVYGAISIALSFALSYIRFFKMPQGGSITFASLLPLLIYCCMFGTKKGIIVCLIYGVLQAVQDPWIIHPLQFLLDYPLAFGVIGISGIFVELKVFKEKKIIGFILGSIIAVTLRFSCHVISGIFAFADYADLATYSTTLVYSMAYNSSVFIDMAIALFCGSMLFASKSFVSQMDRSSEIQLKDEVVINDEMDDIDRQIEAAQKDKDNSL